MDREKVIKALKLCSDALYCADPSSRCSQCPYRTKDMTGTDERNCSDILMADALALLEMEYINTTEVATSIEVGE